MLIAGMLLMAGAVVGVLLSGVIRSAAPSSTYCLNDQRKLSHEFMIFRNDSGCSKGEICIEVDDRGLIEESVRATDCGPTSE